MASSKHYPTIIPGKHHPVLARTLIFNTLRPFFSSYLTTLHPSPAMSDKVVGDKRPELGLPFQEEPSTEVLSESRRRHHTLRTEITAFLGELIGTFMFFSLAFSGTQIALNAADSQQLAVRVSPDVGKLLYIAFAFGVSLAINVAIFADVSGGKFNPAVSQYYSLCP